MIQKWLLTLASRGLFTLSHTRCMCDLSPAVPLVVLSAGLDILLMVVYSLLIMEALIAGPDCQEFDGCMLLPLWLTSSQL